MFRLFYLSMLVLLIISNFACTDDGNTEKGGNAMYNLTFEVGEGGSYAAGTDINVKGTYKAGERISLPPTRPFPGFVFDKWISSNGGCFDNANKPETYFTMPESDTTITATFKQQ